jgi:hypothetical protein
LVDCQDDTVGGVFMVEDGPFDTDSIEHIKEVTNIKSDNVAALYIGLGGTSAALGARLYERVEEGVGKYFEQKGVVPTPADVENEAVRFALWMYRERDCEADSDNDDLYD